MNRSPSEAQTADQIPTGVGQGADAATETLKAWLRERHAYLVGLGAKETYEGAAHAHIERLTVALATANANHERFEREWYLRGDEIERLQKRVAELERVDRDELLRRLDEWFAAYMHDRHNHDEAAWLFARVRELREPSTKASAPPAARPSKEVLQAWIRDASNHIESGFATDMIAVSPVALRQMCLDALARATHEPPADARLQALERVYQKASELIAFIGHNGEAYSTHGQVEDLTCALDDCDRTAVTKGESYG